MALVRPALIRESDGKGLCYIKREKKTVWTTENAELITFSPVGGASDTPYNQEFQAGLCFSSFVFKLIPFSCWILVMHFFFVSDASGLFGMSSPIADVLNHFKKWLLAFSSMIMKWISIWTSPKFISFANSQAKCIWKQVPVLSVIRIYPQAGYIVCLSIFSDKISLVEGDRHYFFSHLANSH